MLVKIAKVTVEMEGYEPMVYDKIVDLSVDITPEILELEFTGHREYQRTGRQYVRISLTNDEKAC
jgi:hypothetical protein